MIINNDEKIVNIYNQLSSIILETYQIMTKDPNLNLTKEDVLISFDNYFVSLILDTILSYRSLYAGEINFINNLTKYSDYFKDIKISREIEPEEQINNHIKSIAHSFVNKAPKFAILFVMADKNLENSVKTKSETFSSRYYNELKDLRDYLLDDNSLLEDNLLPLYDFMKAQKVII